MAATRSANAVWNGNLTEGSGTTSLATSGLGTFDVTWKARTEAAMAFSNKLANAGHTPEEVRTKADVTFVPGTGITGSHLTMSARVPGISEDEFQKIAADAKVGCPVSGALASIDITLDATLES
jgi:lipoyl-dependent peroxiredoxin